MINSLTSVYWSVLVVTVFDWAAQMASWLAEEWAVLQSFVNYACRRMNKTWPALERELFVASVALLQSKPLHFVSLLTQRLKTNLRPAGAGRPSETCRQGCFLLLVVTDSRMTLKAWFNLKGSVSGALKQRELMVAAASIRYWSWISARYQPKKTNIP